MNILAVPGDPRSRISGYPDRLVPDSRIARLLNNDRNYNKQIPNHKQITIPKFQSPMNGNNILVIVIWGLSIVCDSVLGILDLILCL